MTIWIDAPAWPAHGRLWSHLVSDTSFEELHRFAAAAGLPRRGFEGDHYDVPEERYAALVAAGARPVDGRELVRLLQASGLRIPKRRHERVLLSHGEPPWLPPGSRADVIASRQQLPPADTVVVRLLAHAHGSVLVVPRPDGGLDLPSRRVATAPAAGNTAAVGAGTSAAVGAAVSEVQAEAVGEAGEVTLVGYVRNTVPAPLPDYPWPAPRACFAVFHRELDSGVPFGRGHWLSLNEAADHLAQRHWWPLLPEYFSHPGRHG
ncbi:DUF4031 domain-containing protein [Knoellia sp. p5-6-4]|uniref:DUF4031 domain-containing protein n=1 Tax=unclassified Knoellia TaxID=2618719 RepID=UPI0023DA7592|nr:DUF4031 domain-containing protein [Knoellia sp. p5-6-4]MDF2145539.1 DUF4031 domain-containing protein [Knoellia sp. p5-6-4]